MNTKYKKKQRIPKLEPLFWLLLHKADWSLMHTNEIINTLKLAAEFDKMINKLLRSIEEKSV